jgi:hypothetical protein
MTEAAIRMAGEGTVRTPTLRRIARGCTRLFLLERRSFAALATPTIMVAEAEQVPMSAHAHRLAHPSNPRDHC